MRLSTNLPDASRHNPDPAYLRDLLAAIKDDTLLSNSPSNKGSVSQVAVANRLGIAPRTLRQYLDDCHKSKCPYTVQYALEQLAGITYDTYL